MKRSLFSIIVRQAEEESGAEICAVTFDVGNKSFVLKFDFDRRDILDNVTW